MADASVLNSYASVRSADQMASEMDVDTRTIRRWVSGETEVPKLALRLMSTHLYVSVDAPPPKFRFIDLFAGIGGTRIGFERAGGQCVFTSEWNKFAQHTYAANFKNTREHQHAGDITAVHAADIPDHDVLVGGFPCQPFSIAGVSKKNSLGRAHGFADATQGTLFFDVARIIDEKRPEAFVLENVKNLVSHDHGRTFAVIMDTLKRQLGYHVVSRVIDASPWVPQRRRRIFIVGFREPSGFDFDDLQVPSEGPTMRDVLHREDGSDIAEAPYTDASGMVSDKYVLTEHLWSYLQRYADKHKAAGNGFGFGLVGPDDVARTLSARYHKDGSEILVSRGANQIPRRLTPRECARLMGFDDRFTIPVSDTQAYRQFGNSVVVPVVEAIAQLVQTNLARTRI